MAEEKPLSDAQASAVDDLLSVALNVATRANRKPKGLTTLLAADRKKAQAAASVIGGDVNISQRVRVLLRQGANGVTYGGPVAPTYGSTRRATNIVNISYYDPGQNFLNIILDSGASWYDPDIGGNPVSAYQSALGWPTNVPAGKRLRMLVKGDMSPYVGYFKPGQYRLTCSNPNFTIRLLKIGGTYVSGTSSVTYTFAANEVNTNWLFVEVYNAAASAQSITPGRDGIVLRHTDNDALWAAGEVWDPLLLTSLAGECFLRFMDSTGGIGGYASTAEIAPDRDSFLGGFWPPEVCADLCKKLGCGAWYCMGYLRDQLCWESTASTNTFRVRQDYGDTLYVAPPCTEGQEIYLSTWYGTTEAFSGMDAGPWFAKNVTSTTFQIAATAGGTAIDLTIDNSGASHLRGFTRRNDQLAHWQSLINRFHTYYPACPEFHPETLNEGWNYGFHSYGFTQSVLQHTMGVNSRAGSANWQEAWGKMHGYLWSYVEAVYPRNVSRRTFTAFSYNCGGYENGIRYTMPTGTPYAGQTVLALMDEFAIATYTPDANWYDAWTAGFHTMTNAQRDTYCAIDMTNMRVNGIGNWFLKLAEWGRSGSAAPRFTTYETNESFKGQRSIYSVGIEPYPGTPATTSASQFEDAVQAYFYGSGGVNWRAAMAQLHTDFSCDAYNNYTNRGKIGYRGEYIQHWGEVDKPGDTNAYRAWRIASFRPLGA